MLWGVPDGGGGGGGEGGGRGGEKVFVYSCDPRFTQTMEEPHGLGGLCKMSLELITLTD